MKFLGSPLELAGFSKGEEAMQKAYNIWVFDEDYHNHIDFNKTTQEALGFGCSSNISQSNKPDWQFIIPRQMVVDGITGFSTSSYGLMVSQKNPTLHILKLAYK